MHGRWWWWWWGEKAERAVRWVVATTSGPPLVGAPHASNEQSTPSLRRELRGILYYWLPPKKLFCPDEGTNQSPDPYLVLWCWKKKKHNLMHILVLHKPWAIEFLNTPIQIYNFNWKSQEGGNSQFTHILTWIQWSLRVEICYSPFFLLLPFSANCPSNQRILTLAIFWICKSLLPRESNFWPKNTNSRAPSHNDHHF